MISSTQNLKIKTVRGLQGKPKFRRASGLILCEGVRLVEEAFLSGWKCSFVLYSGGQSERAQALIEKFHERGDAAEETLPEVFREICDTETSQGILAVVEKKTLPVLPDGDLYLIPARLRDPGNLGTLIRTAAAAGVSTVYIPPDTVDPFSPKVLRAGMGAHFRVPIENLSWEEIWTRLKSRPHLRTYLAAAEKGIPYTQADLKMPTAIVVGGEAFGAGEDVAAWIDETVHIPMPGATESLNAAVAGAILLFEALRQRGEENSTRG